MSAKRFDPKTPSVICQTIPTPSPSFKTVCAIVVSLVVVYFMLSAWDDFLDEAIRNVFGLKDTLSGRFARACIASWIAFTVLVLLEIDIDDLMGVFLHDAII